MKLERGNMWDIFGKTDLFLITTNPVRKKDGAVVMGRGIALEAKVRFPQLPYDFGRELDRAEAEGEHNCSSGIIGVYDNQLVGYFMTKSHWQLNSEITIINDSITDLLLSWQAHKHYNRIDLNFPGIGNGKLKREDVLPIIEQLPDNVHVWEY